MLCTLRSRPRPAVHLSGRASRPLRAQVLDAQASSRAPRRPRAREDHHPLTIYHSPIHPFTHSPIHSLIPYPLRRIRSFTPSPHSTSAQQPRKYVYVHVHTAYIVAHTFMYSTYILHIRLFPFPVHQSHTRANSKPTARRETRDARREMRDANREKVLLTTMPSRRGPLEAPPPGARARPIW